MGSATVTDDRRVVSAAVIRPRVMFLVPVVALAVVMVLLWIPFGWRTNGLVEEWGLIDHIEAGTPIFVITDQVSLQAQSIRPLTFATFALAYILSPDSPVGFNVLYSIILVLKGIAAFLLLRILLPERPGLAFVASAIYAIYPANTMNFTFRAMNVQFAALMYLFSVSLLIVFWRYRHLSSLILLWISLAISLLTYEVAYPAVLLTPLLLVWLAGGFNRRVFVTAALWYVVPILTAARTVVVLLGTTATYQGDVIRTGASASGLTEMLGALIRAYEQVLIVGWTDTLKQPAWSPLYILLATAIVVVTVAAAVIIDKSQGKTQDMLPRNRFVVLVIAGLLLIFLGFSPYLLSPFHRSQYLWTLYLASFGAVLAFSAVIWQLSELLRFQRLYLIIVSVALLVSGVSAFNQHRYYRELALHQQNILGQMVEQAPQIRDDTLVVVVDEAKALETVWSFMYSGTFASAVHYIYSNQSLSAIICYPDSEMRALTDITETCRFEPDQLLIEVGSRSNQEIKTTVYPYTRVLVFRYLLNHDLVLAQRLESSRPSMQPIERYHARTAITAAKPVRRDQAFFACWPIEPCTSEPLPPPAGRFSTEFDETFSGSGWRTTERLADGTTYRWTRSPTTRLLLRLVPGHDYSVRFRVIAAIDPAVLRTLVVRANDELIPLVSRQDETGATVFHGLVPREVLPNSSSDLVLAFSIDYLGVPTNGDEALGIAFDWLKVDPTTPRQVAAQEFDGGIQGTGWRVPEMTPSGITFQWTTQPDATIILGPLAQNDYLLELRVVNAVKPTILKSVQLKMNGVLLTLTRQNDGQGGTIFKALVPREAIARDSLQPRLALLVNETVAPPGDADALGVAVDWLRLEALDG